MALVLLIVLGRPVLAQGGEDGRVILGEDFTLPTDHRLDGDLVVFGGDVDLEPGSTVRGAVLVFGGEVHIAGRVDGDVLAFGGDVTLAESAVVGGNVLSTNGYERHPGAIVNGQVIDSGGHDGVQIPARPQPVYSGWPWEMDWVWHTWQSVLGALAMVVIGVVVVLLVPGLTRTAGETLVSYPVQSTFVGLLAGLVTSVAIVLLTITCLGIPVALLLSIALAVAVLFGWIAAGLVLGERLLVALNPEVRSQPPVAVAAGLVILALIGLLPCLNWLLGILVGTWGLGAVVLTRFGSRPYVPGAAIP